MINWYALCVGLGQASIDVFALGLVKVAATTASKSQVVKLMIMPMFTYMLQPLITYFILQTETLTITNLIWDLTSDILVSLIGIFYFGERLGRVRTAGLLVGMIALVLLAQKDGFDDRPTKST